MKPVLTALTTLILALSGAAEAGAETLILRNVRLAAPGAVETAPLSRIVIDGDRIVAVEPEHEGAVAGAVIDGAGAWASPGLWDAHIHALGDAEAAVARTLPLLVAHGVTGVRDMGAVPEKIVEVRARLAADPALARPRLYVSGPLLDGQALPWYGDLPLVLKTPEEVPPALARLKAQGMDFLKIYSGLKPEVLDAIGAEAGRLGLPTAGHVTLSAGLSGAARIGQRSVEHLSVSTFLECLPDDPGFFNRWVGSAFQSGYDALWDLELDFDRRADWARCDTKLGELAAAGTAFTPTLGMVFLDRAHTDMDALQWAEPRARDWCLQNLERVETADPARRAQAYDLYRRMLARVREAGLTILAGTDAPNFCLVAGSSLLVELELLVESGLTPAEAVEAATVAPARLMGRSADIGRVAPGFVADVLLTRANPYADVRAYRDLQWVVAAGRAHDAAALAAMKRAAVVAD